MLDHVSSGITLELPQGSSWKSSCLVLLSPAAGMSVWGAEQRIRGGSDLLPPHLVLDQQPREAELSQIFYLKPELDRDQQNLLTTGHCPLTG